MIKIIPLVFFLLVTVSGLVSCNRPETKKPESIQPTGDSASSKSGVVVVREDFKRFYDDKNVDGCIVVFDQNANKKIVYNSDMANRQITPASTFKIFNSLVGLETGVIENENYVIPWDGIQREIKDWNRDHDLRSAYKYSVVWYYQELARRVGGPQMKHWLDTVQYGNTDTSGALDKFWLTGGLRISPSQQIDFLRQLHDGSLPFSKRSIDIVKGIMKERDTAGYILRAKTGWAVGDSADTGWYVGYVETDGNVYYFANCITGKSKVRNDFGNARKEIVYSILDSLNVIKKD